VLSVIRESDTPEEAFANSFPFPVIRVLSSPGLTRQRNLGVRSLTTDAGIVLLLDDDMILHREYIAKVSRTFTEHPACVCLMGHLLANGDVSEEEANRLVNSPIDLGEKAGRYFPVKARWGSLYGCNMSFRRQYLEQEPFDERLPLYSEMEDTDMGTRIRKYGEIGYSFGPLAVHLKTGSGSVLSDKLIE
jgi:GT2 family glycosyltransferase